MPNKNIGLKRLNTVKIADLQYALRRIWRGNMKQFFRNQPRLAGCAAMDFIYSGDFCHVKRRGRKKRKSGLVKKRRKKRSLNSRPLRPVARVHRDRREKPAFGVLLRALCALREAAF